jgi:hypothetical protein
VGISLPLFESRLINWGDVLLRSTVRKTKRRTWTVLSTN